MDSHCLSVIQSSLDVSQSQRARILSVLMGLTLGRGVMMTRGTGRFHSVSPLYLPAVYSGFIEERLQGQACFLRGLGFVGESRDVNALLCGRRFGSGESTQSA